MFNSNLIKLIIICFCLNFIVACATEVGEQHGSSGGIIKILKGSALDFASVTYEAENRCRTWNKQAYAVTKVDTSGIYRTYSYQCVSKE